MSAPAPPSPVDRLRRVRETERPGELPALHHPGWAERFPWLVQGVTTRGAREEPFDLAVFGDAPGARVHGRWELLRRETGCPRAVHGRQVHEARVLLHGDGLPGLFLAPSCDGHVTRAPGVLLTVATADCTAVSVVDPELRAVALLHAGWRGTAANILARGVEVLRDRLGSDPSRLHVHLGPAICGRCYEVGPEVHRTLGLPEPDAPEPVDVHGVLFRQAEELGIAPDRLSASSLCTLCGEAPLFSHRGGSRCRQVSFLGIDPVAERVGGGRGAGAG